MLEGKIEGNEHEMAQKIAKLAIEVGIQKGNYDKMVSRFTEEMKKEVINDSVLKKDEENAE